MYGFCSLFSIVISLQKLIIDIYLLLFFCLGASVPLSAAATVFPNVASACGWKGKHNAPHIATRILHFHAHGHKRSLFARTGYVPCEDDLVYALVEKDKSIAIMSDNGTEVAVCMFNALLG